MQILTGVTIFAGAFFIMLVILQIISIAKKYLFNNEKKILQNRIIALRMRFVDNRSYSSYVKKDGTISYGYGPMDKKDNFLFPLEEAEI